MAKFPQVGSQFQQERAGVNAVARIAANLGLIWRENQIKDIGIDGQLEYVTAEGFATGRLIAVQVKSGESYFSHEDENCWRFYPEEKHRLYWERFPIPVILVLHDPSTEHLPWIDVRHELRSGVLSETIKVPKNRSLEDTSAQELFTTSGVIAGEFSQDLNQVLSLMIGKLSPGAGFPVSYFELFVHGLTNIVRSLYFGMDLATTIAEATLDLNDAEYGVCIGEPEDSFLFDYIKFIVSQDLATIDFGDCLIDRNDRLMVPKFLAPLTSRGRTLVKIVNAHEDRLRSLGVLSSDPHLRVAQERFLQMIFTPTDMERIALVRSFEAQLNQEPNSE